MTRLSVLSVWTLMLVLVGRPPLVSAADLVSGTWKVNVAKSSFNPGPGLQSQIVKFESKGDSWTVIVDSTGPDGKLVHSEWLGKFDGKDYPMIGDPNIDTRSFKKIDDYTLEIVAKSKGKVVSLTKTVYARNGKTRVSTQTGVNAQGQKVSNTIVSEKQ
jgi:hypothetical protein